MQKFEHLDNEKSFLDEIKSIFRNYVYKGCHLVKEKKKNSGHKL